MKRTVLITGSAQGIGQAAVKLFKKNNWFVIGIDNKISKKNTDLFLKADLSDEHTPEKIKTFFDQNKINKLDALVNNAAVQIVKSFQDISRDDWLNTFSVNAEAPFFLSQKLLPKLRKARGSVINIASIHANLTKECFSVYAASKGAMISLTQALAIELAPHIRVNAVLPAATDTPMLRKGFSGNKNGYNTLAQYHPLKRIAKPDEVAKTIYFLADDKSSFITGASIPVNGGIGALLHDPGTR